MMKLCIYASGTCGGAEAELVKTYSPRIKQAARQIGLDGPHLSEIKPHHNFDRLLKNVPDALVIALDEGGKSLSSRAFATALDEWRTQNATHLCFIIGGADGLPQTIKTRANAIISLSAMTLPHILARVILYEQIWRALSILTHHPYHRD